MVFLVGDEIDGAVGAVEIGGGADLLDGRDGLFVVAPEIEGGFVGIDGGGMARGWWGSCSEEEAGAVFGEGEGGVVVDDEAFVEAGCGGGDDERGFGFGGLPEVEIVEGFFVCGGCGGVADEGEFVGVVVPGEVLVVGFAGDEFVRGFGVPAGGCDGEDAVGFGFGREDGVGEGFAVLAELIVEDVGEVAGGVVGEFEKGEEGAGLGSREGWLVRRLRGWLRFRRVFCRFCRRVWRRVVERGI